MFMSLINWVDWPGVIAGMSVLVAYMVMVKVTR